MIYPIKSYYAELTSQIYIILLLLFLERCEVIHRTCSPILYIQILSI